MPSQHTEKAQSAKHIPVAASFTRLLLRLNPALAQKFSKWHFPAGACFAEAQQWWNNKPRLRDHEGVDFFRYQNSAGNHFPLPNGSLIPACRSGEVLALFADFLGCSIVVGHNIEKSHSEMRLCTVYAHCQPTSGLAVGQQVNAGQHICTLIENDPPAAVPDHLHLSMFWLDSEYKDRFNWRAIATDPRIRLVDPLPWLN